jgi:hypothetical protein
MSREIETLVQGADAVAIAEGNTDRRDRASAWTTLVVLDPGMEVRSLNGNREISCSTASEVMERSASGRRGVEADEERAGEVRPLQR